MTAAVLIVLAGPGLALGSFLNVVASRVPRRRSLWRPGSSCMSCAAPVAWYDNVPLLSWAVLRGRCRSCGTRISAVYPAVELVTALLVVACFLAFGLTGRAAVAAFFCIVLVVVSAIDLEHRIIPNAIVLPATGVVVVVNTLLEPGVEWTLAALACSAFLFLAVRSAARLCFRWGAIRSLTASRTNMRRLASKR